MSNTALTLNRARQFVLYAEQVVNFANIAETGVGVEAVKLPPNAEIVGGDVTVDTAWNAGTSAKIALGDSTDADRYLADLSVQAAGRTVLVPTGYVTDGTPLVITPAIVGDAPTAGSLRIRLQYVIQGRAHEVQTN